jgi:hypothetical protein
MARRVHDGPAATTLAACTRHRLLPPESVRGDDPRSPPRRGSSFLCRRVCCGYPVPIHTVAETGPFVHSCVDRPTDWLASPGDSGYVVATPPVWIEAPARSALPGHDRSRSGAGRLPGNAAPGCCSGLHRATALGCIERPARWGAGDGSGWHGGSGWQGAGGSSEGRARRRVPATSGIEERVRCPTGMAPAPRCRQTGRWC